MSSRRHHRKKVYVSSAIQGRLMVRLAAYFVGYHAFLWHIMFLTQQLPASGAASFMERYAAFFAQNALLLVCMAAALPILMWDMLKFSHRIAGPFVRFEQALKQMARGKFIEPISLRKGDLVVEFLNVFNEFILARNRDRGSDLPSVAIISACREQTELNDSTPDAQETGSHEDNLASIKFYAD